MTPDRCQAGEHGYMCSIAVEYEQKLDSANDAYEQASPVERTAHHRLVHAAWMDLRRHRVECIGGVE